MGPNYVKKFIMSKDCCSTNILKVNETGGIDPFIAGSVIVTILLLVGMVLIGTRNGSTPSVVSSDKIEIATDSTKYDWGNIEYSDGIVSKIFNIKNSGDSVLKLYNVTTSCMCTTAQLITPNNKSGKFGMNTKSTAVFEVNPGETAQLVVEFDPAFHGPSGVGAINRTVTINTNSSQTPELSFQVEGFVVKK